MVEEQKQRIEQEITKVVDELDHSYLRKMQANMHRCAARCCDNNDLSLDSLQKCVEKCSISLSWAQNFVQNELTSIQNKLQRCVMDCNDDVRVKLGPNPTEQDITKYTNLFENCAKSCVDKQMDYIPLLLQRIKRELDGKN